ncbi:MAG: hypothetical protein RLZZ555_1971 [Pseudomonadota bacterium]|jgi:uncharacterized RDD family membrane protein YckC
MACWLYEGVLLFGVVFVAGLLFSVITQTRHGLQNRPELQGFIFLLLGLYFSWFWRRGQTLPMRTWHVRIVGPDGLPPTLGRALIRYLLSWLWLLPPLAARAIFSLPLAQTLVLLAGWIAAWAFLSRFHPGRQFWHDAWAGTRLVSAPPGLNGKPATKRP